jgi:hypothetical protein
MAVYSVRAVPERRLRTQHLDCAIGEFRAMKMQPRLEWR